MFIAALFTIAKTWKDPKCPSTDEWIKKMWCTHTHTQTHTHTYTHTIDSYSAIKRNEILPFAATWMDLENIILSEVSQMERQILYDTTYLWNLKNNTNELIYKTEAD